MAALAVVEPETGTTDPLTRWLDDVLTQLGATVADAGEVSDAVRIDRIAALEQLRAVTAAAQAAECVRFAQSQVNEQLAAEVHPTAIGRGIADQIALACRISPHAGSRRLGTARAWWFDLPATYAELTTGGLSERVADLVVTETRHLDADTRRSVDAQIIHAGITEMGVREAAACTRRLAYQADPPGYVQRGRTERHHRRVGLRPAPDTMAILTAYLPVEQGVACYAALTHHADSMVATGDVRSRDQIMADTLVERVTGQTTATDLNIEVHILLPVESLVDPDSPRTGSIVGGDPHRRRFDGWLAQLIRLRDHTCRDPYCDAPIRHLDHIIRRADRGPTTLANGRGVCARGNYVREMPGWRVDLIHHGHTGHPHTVQIRTPTGHTYLSRAPDPP